MYTAVWAIILFRRTPVQQSINIDSQKVFVAQTNQILTSNEWWKITVNANENCDNVMSTHDENKCQQWTNLLEYARTPHK